MNLLQSQDFSTSNQVKIVIEQLF